MWQVACVAGGVALGFTRCEKWGPGGSRAAGAATFQSPHAAGTVGSPRALWVLNLNREEREVREEFQGV